MQFSIRILEQQEQLSMQFSIRILEQQEQLSMPFSIRILEQQEQLSMQFSKNRIVKIYLAHLPAFILQTTQHMNNVQARSTYKCAL